VQHALGMERNGKTGLLDIAGNRHTRETNTLTHLLGNGPHHTAATLKRLYAPPHVSCATVWRGSLHKNW